MTCTRMIISWTASTSAFIKGHYIPYQKSNHLDHLFFTVFQGVFHPVTAAHSALNEPKHTV